MCRALRRPDLADWLQKTVHVESLRKAIDASAHARLWEAAAQGCYITAQLHYDAMQSAAATTSLLEYQAYAAADWTTSQLARVLPTTRSSACMIPSSNLQAVMLDGLRADEQHTRGTRISAPVDVMAAIAALPSDLAVLAIQLSPDANELWAAAVTGRAPSDGNGTAENLRTSQMSPVSDSENGQRLCFCGRLPLQCGDLQVSVGSEKMSYNDLVCAHIA